jgi:hypothetical protein
MNKIVMLSSLLFFFLAIIFFSQRGYSIEEVLIRSFAVFVFLAFMLSAVVIFFIKAVNKMVIKKSREKLENSVGNLEHE